MGHEIVYCSGCKTQLRASDFDAGTAVYAKDYAVCIKCLPSLLSSLPEKERIKFLQVLPTKEPNTKETKESDTSRRGSTTFIPTAAPKTGAFRRPRQSSVNFVVAGVFVFVAIGIVLMLLSSHPNGPDSVEVPAGTSAPKLTQAPQPSPPSSPGTPPDRTPKSPPSLPPDPSPPVTLAKKVEERPAPTPKREEEAKQALQKLRDFRQANPTAFARQIELAQEVVWTAESTSSLDDAKKELEDCKKKQGEFFQSEFAPVDQSVMAACAKEEFGRAFDLLDEARKRQDNPQWKLIVSKKDREVNDAAYRLLDTLKTSALAARRKGSSQELQLIRDRVTRWGVASLLEDFEKALRAR